ncbi:hypothetical protein AAF712_013512 [Marasmius tenuissimus]|uniref:Uncharacterized protein n=1 Tax=Marasmius tenuissimus TaxID=585030 RepID=A0ABR2ZFI3_9AGAR
MDADAGVRASARLAIQRLVGRFPQASSFIRLRDATVETVSMLLENLAVARHEHTNPELQNTDPDLLLLHRKVAAEQPEASASQPRDGKNASGASEGGPDEAGPHSSCERANSTRKPPAKRTKLSLAELPDVKWSISQEDKNAQHACGKTGPDFTLARGLKGKERDQLRNRLRNAHNNELRLGRELVQPSEGFGSMLAASRIASTFWQGVNVKGDQREEVRKRVEDGEKFEGIKPIPYTGNRTYVADRSGIVFIFRSVVTASILNHLLPAVEEAASKFMEAVIWPTDGDMKKNLRGNHFFCGAGHDRNNKKVPSLSKWHTANAKAVEAFFAPGQPLHAATRYGCSLLEKEFPDIAQRYKTCAEEMKRKFNISPLFGGFYWNFCLNGVRLGGPTPVPRVFCKPHIDFKNLALGVCMIFVYGHFDHKRKCWLVIWEAGIALELPMGIFVLYPSSLFLHFNVDADNLQFVVTDGNEPTKDSCRPLSCLCGDPTKITVRNGKRRMGEGLWCGLIEASMFQTTELGYNTVEEARSAGAETDCDIKGLLEKGIFPQVHVSLDE